MRRPTIRPSAIRPIVCQTLALLAILAGILLVAGNRAGLERLRTRAQPAQGPPASPTPEPLVPTVPAELAVPGSGGAGELSGLGSRGAGEPGSRGDGEMRSWGAGGGGQRWRFGVGVPLPPIDQYAVESLGIGWYLNWRVDVRPPRPHGLEFAQMVRVSQTGFRPGLDVLADVVSANPGSLWLIGNEPDVRWQDNTTPERYAQVYHQLYAFLKEHDPTGRVAIGGVSQPTPLRLAYLDRVLTAYQQRYGHPMPVDVWNVHAFILREERGSWGVGIPPGFDEDRGVLYEIDDHDDLDIFKAQIEAFRRWMAERGRRDRPLIISEYGVLMPAAYGFPVERVGRFMSATFDYFLSARDDAIGYPADGNRLVQRWAWYSLADTRYPTGNLFDPETKQLTRLGRAYAGYVQASEERPPRFPWIRRVCAISGIFPPRFVWMWGENLGGLHGSPGYRDDTMKAHH